MRHVVVVVLDNKHPGFWHFPTNNVCNASFRRIPSGSAHYKGHIHHQSWMVRHQAQSWGGIALQKRHGTLLELYRITGHWNYPGPFFHIFFFNMASTLKAAATQATKSTITPTRAFFRVSDSIPSVAHAREVFKTLGSYGDMVEYKLLRVSDISGGLTSMTTEPAR